MIKRDDDREKTPTNDDYPGKGLAERIDWINICVKEF
jgi:hypothetical protein